MYSRYDAMVESKVIDSEDQVSYPDVLSLNLNNAKLTEIPKLRTLSKTDIDRFWVFILGQFQTAAEGDDLVLSLNNVPYLGMLQAGSEIYIPSLTDTYNIQNLAGVV